MKALPREGIVLAVALALYILLSPRFDVGTFGDDARDILATRSLLQGHYVQLSTPMHPPANFPLPGFPLLLTPFVFFLGPAWHLLKIVPMACTVGAGYFLYRIARFHLAPLASCIILSLYVFNPTTLAFSSRVIADSFFLLIVLAAFYVLERFLTQEHSRDLFLAGVLAGGASITRPEGGLLLVAFTVAFALQRRWGRAFIFLAIAAPPLLLVLARNWWATGSLTGYSVLWRDTLPFLSNSIHFLKHAGQVLKTLFVDATLGVVFQEKPSTLAVGASVLGVIFLSLITLLGFHRSLVKNRHASTGSPWAVAAGIYIGLYLLLHATWLALDPHYLWPLVPFVLLFITVGIRDINSGSPGLRRGVLAIPLMVGLIYAGQGVFAIGQIVQPPPSNRVPRRTVEWVRGRLDDTAFLLTPSAPMIYLYTDRHATAFVSAGDSEEYRYKLLQSSITHVLIQPTSFLHVDAVARRSPQWVWQQTPRWLRQSPQGFEKLFVHEIELTEVYALRPDEAFRKAYVLYIEGMEAIRQGQPERAFKDFTLAIRTDPTCVTALNAYGATCLYTGRHLSEGERYLVRAVDQQPEWPIVWVNLARLSHRLGKKDQASAAYARARDVILQLGEPQTLLPVIQAEQNSL